MSLWSSSFPAPAPGSQPRPLQGDPRDTGDARRGGQPAVSLRFPLFAAGLGGGVQAPAPRRPAPAAAVGLAQAGPVPALTRALGLTTRLAFPSETEPPGFGPSSDSLTPLRASASPCTNWVERPPSLRRTEKARGASAYSVARSSLPWTQSCLPGARPPPPRFWLLCDPSRCRRGHVLGAWGRWGSRSAGVRSGSRPQRSGLCSRIETCVDPHWQECWKRNDSPPTSFEKAVCLCVCALYFQLCGVWGPRSRGWAWGARWENKTTQRRQ